MAVGALIPPVQLSTSALVGDAYPGAKLYTYLSGTSTPQVVYSDYALTTPRTNPVVADSLGVFPVIYTAAVAYRILMTDSAGATILPAIDHVYDFAEVQLAASGGSALVGFIQAGSGAVARTAQGKMREWVTAQDFGAVGDGVTNDTAAINAAFGSGAGTVRLLTGTYFTTGSITVGSDGVSQCLLLDAGATLAYAPTSGTDPAVKLYDASSVMGESRRKSIVTVARDGCDGIKTVANTSNDNKPLIEALSIRDIANVRTAGAGIRLDINAGMRSIIRDLEISQFYDGVYYNRAFVTLIEGVNVEGCFRDGFHFTGSGTSISILSTYANNCVRHGYYFSGGQEYCTLTGTASDFGAVAGGSGWGYYLDKTDGVVCRTFTFNSVGCEAADADAVGAIYCEEGNGHVFNSPNLVNTTGAGTNNGMWFAGTTDVMINRGLLSGWRGVGAAQGHDLVAVTSSGSVAPARIVVFNPAANNISFPTQNGRFYAPDGGVSLMQADTGWSNCTLLNSWVNYGSTYQTAQYMRDSDGFVHVRGTIKDGTVVDGTPLFTLAANYRPVADLLIGTASNNEIGSVQVLTSGIVQFHRGTNTQFSIDLSFKGVDVPLNSQTPL